MTIIISKLNATIAVAAFRGKNASKFRCFKKKNLKVRNCQNFHFSLLNFFVPTLRFLPIHQHLSSNPAGYSAPQNNNDNDNNKGYYTEVRNRGEYRKW